jgi:membrane associated rhomboid family serine protease
MVLPLGDAPNPRGVPVVTYGLLLANVAVYLFISLPLMATAADPRDPLLLEYLRVVVENLGGRASAEQILRQVSAYDLFVFRYGFRPAEPSLVDLFASLFLHGGFLHLLGNMLFLWIYGDNVEHRLGAFPYLVAYLATGVAATLFHMLFEMDSELPMVGASGAISGVLGFYFIWFPRNRVRLLFLFFPFFMDVITVPARILLGLYLIADNLLPFLLTRGSGMAGVAYSAHIGGFLAGWAGAWLLDRREIGSRPVEYKTVRIRKEPTVSDRIRAAIGQGRFAEAAEEYFALDAAATHRLLSPEESLALADWLLRHGHERAALTVYRRHLRDHPHHRSAAAAHVGAGIVQLEALDQPTAAYQHFLDALELDPSPETAAQIRRLLDVIGARQKFQIGRHPAH